YKHLLFAMDLSLESTLMLQRTAIIAGIFKAQLSIIHVIEKVENSNPLNQLELTKTLLDKLLQPFQKLKPDVFIEFGEVEDKILKTATNNNIDLIVIGSHGRKGDNPLLGSTAKAVLSDLRCDVQVM